MNAREFDDYDRRIHAIPLDDAIARVLGFAIEGQRSIFRDPDEIVAEAWLKRIAEERGILTPTVRC